MDLFRDARVEMTGLKCPRTRVGGELFARAGDGCARVDDARGARGRARRVATATATARTVAAKPGRRRVDARAARGRERRDARSTRGVASSWVLTVDVDDGDGVVFERGASRVARGGRGRRARTRGVDRGELGGRRRRGWGAGGGDDGGARASARGRRALAAAACVAALVGLGACARAHGAEMSGRERGVRAAALGGEARSGGTRRRGAPRRAAPRRAAAAAAAVGQSEAESGLVVFNEAPEYTCAKRNKALREAAYAARMGSPWTPGCHSKLGEEGCTKISDAGARLAALSDHVYVICMKCDKIVLPLQWAGKVTTVHGADIDPCYGRAAADHWHKASMSHVHALLDAVKYQYKTVTIVEEDAITVSPDRVDANAGFDIDGLEHAIKNDSSWNTVRVGYRPYFFEQQSANVPVGSTPHYACPLACKCHETTAKNACIVRENGCDMRSSDFYMIRMSQSRAIRKTVGAGSTIDMEALRNVHHQMYVLPQLSYQANLDRTREQQVNMAHRFRDLCFVPKTPSDEAVQDAATAEREYEERVSTIESADSTRYITKPQR